MAIDPRAIIDESCGPVEIASSARIEPMAYLRGPLRIGERTRVGAFSVIGAPPKKRGATRAGRLVIEDDCDIAEHVVIDAPTTEHGSCFGARTHVLPFVFMGHDAQIESDVTVTAHVSIGGFVTIAEGANLGLGAVVHQRRRIGAYSMIGMHATITSDCRAFGVYVGTPAKFAKVNAAAFDRAGISEIERIQVLQAWTYSQVELSERLAKWFGDKG